jgi:hypothetical protein
MRTGSSRVTHGTIESWWLVRWLQVKETELNEHALKKLRNVGNLYPNLLPHLQREKLRLLTLIGRILLISPSLSFLCLANQARFGFGLLVLFLEQWLSFPCPTVLGAATIAGAMIPPAWRWRPW